MKCMKRHLSFLLLILLFSQLKARADISFSWSHPFNSGVDVPARKVLTDPEGNVYVWVMADADSVVTSGQVFPGLPSNNRSRMILIKYDPQGTVLQTLRMQVQAPAFGDTYLDIGDFVVDKDQNIYIAGRMPYPMVTLNGNTLFDTTQGNPGQQTFVVKINKYSQVLWKKTAKTVNTLVDDRTLLALDHASNIYLFSSTIATANSTNTGFPGFPMVTNSLLNNEIFFLVKMNCNNGNVTWSKNSWNPNHTQLNALFVDKYDKVYLSYKGNGYDMNGAFETFDYYPGASAIIVKLDGNGAFIWGNTSRSGPDPGITSMDQDSTGNMLFTCVMPSGVDSISFLGKGYIHNRRRSLGYYAAYIAKVDTAGVMLWNEVCYSRYNDIQKPALSVDPANNIYFTCKFQHDLVYGNDTITTLPPSGNTLSVLKIADNRSLISYRKASSTGWASVWANSLANDGAGNVYAAGEMYTDVNTAGSSVILGDSTYYAAGVKNGYIVKLKDGSFISIQSLSASSLCDGDSLKVAFAYNDTLFPTGSMFTMELSDTSGSYSAATALGHLSSSGSGADTFKIIVHTGASFSGAYRLRITSGNFHSSSAGTLSIGALPAVPVISASGNTLSCSMSQVTFQWFLNGTAISGATQSTFAATQQGSYTVTVTNTNGCSRTSDNFSFNPLSIGEKGRYRQLSLSPNPVTGILNVNDADIDFTRQRPTIFNTAGKPVGGFKVTGKTSLNVSGLSAGVYVIRIDDKASVISGVFVKE